MVQTEFDECFGILLTPDPPANYKVEAENYYPLLQCPYCLYSSYSLNDFIILNKKGLISKKMALCPKCHNTQRRKTLIETGKSSWDHYAYWLASSSMYDVDKRIKWPMIFERMRALSSEERSIFWAKYREEKSKLDPNYALRQQIKEYEASFENGDSNSNTEP